MTIDTTTRLTRALAIVAIASAGVALSGCSILSQFTGGGTATRDDSGEVVEGNDNTDVFTLQVGDCLNDATAAETVETIPTVPCDEPHDSEIYASIIMEGDVFPGEDATIAQADQACLDAFAGFVGIDYADSLYYYSYYFPTEGSWAGGDREILCTIYDEAGQTTGSLQNIGR
ncbi:septum formation family protein [Microcella sp.]|uniref:septum formation family protein n=1 Tax=Microcella sp. TaxID=1913979 RepID=UPI00299F632B|nr:septum formation family protein [Microcella sp.]MDX2024881.1 septum formation family protein [Microcella sp.]